MRSIFTQHSGMLLLLPFMLLVLSPIRPVDSYLWGDETNEPEMPQIADPDSYLTDFAELAKQKWPNNRTLNIVCHGHSVPAGYFQTPTVDSMNAYPHLLHEQLKLRYPHAVINVIVTAIGGEESDRGSRRFAEDVLSHKPDLITIDYALNDRRIGLDRARKTHLAMLRAAEEQGIPVILLTPTADQRSQLNDADDPLNQHARQLRDIAAQQHVGLADSIEAFRQKVASGTELKELMSQSNHPNRAGHELVVQELLRWFPE